ncbi:NigD-like C-terminal domain-containing protein [Alloprevotella sp. OH1205_COT-284]|uniref:NigD1/NigD2 family lipoprotein n=1 Tax=Alloprevotella sp. OH1205_COT-284 TaxID=2491043 RepID=UPI0013154EB9|nr:NigD-like C-terminal domain-containing protein [Alloprevotella sp. OH1205_COT-284]
MNSTHLRQLFCGMLVCCGLLLAACNDDDAPFPPWRFELCELTTDARGTVEQVRFDDGRSLSPLQPISALRPDTLYRALALYLSTTDGKADLRRLSNVVSPMPKTFEAGIRTAPVEIITLWRTKRYLNLRIGVPRNEGKKHYFGFANHGIKRHDNGRRCLHLELYHERIGTEVHYYEETFLSCPLYPYADQLTRGTDSVAITINTPTGRQRHAMTF